MANNQVKSCENSDEVTGKSQKPKSRNNRARRSKSNSKRNTASIDHKFNDPKWYVPNDQLVKDVASFSFNTPIGVSNGNRDGYQKYTLTPFPASYTGDRVSGVASLVLTPTVGIATAQTSALNIAATNLYAAIRRANSGAKNYDAPDLMSVVLAVSSAYSCISWLQRLYGLANVYSSQNRYIPKAIIEANGVDFTSIVNNLASFRSGLNLLTLQLNALYIPKGIWLTERWFKLYEKVFTDSSTSKAQIYQYVPSGFYSRDDTTGDLSLATLSFTINPSSERYSYEYLLNYARELINKLLYSEDVGTICGDVYKAFGAEGVYSIPLIPEDYVVLPTDADDIRSQFENAKVLNVDWLKSSVAIQQSADKQFLKATYTIRTVQECGAVVGGKWLNFHHENVTPEDTMVATRLIPGVSQSVYLNATSVWQIQFSSLGSEFASNLNIVIIGEGETSPNVFTSVGYCLTIKEDPDSPMFASGLECIAKLVPAAAFDWFPEIKMFIATVGSIKDYSSAKNLSYVGSIMDYDQGTFLSLENVDRLNETAILGLFGVPRN